MRTKSTLIIFWLALFLLACEKKDKNDFQITYLKSDIYLKLPPNADAEMPPIYRLYFQVKNNSGEKKVFIAKGNDFDDTKSKLTLIDTFNNVSVPLYSNSIVISKDLTYTIKAYIDIRDFKNYFKLDEKFLNRIDFSDDKLTLNKLYIEMINRSIITYEQDTSDLRQYRMYGDPDVQNLSKKIIIKKPKKIK